MDERFFVIRVPKRWVRIASITGVVALILAPLVAVAGDRFTDVPFSHTFHEDIAWLGASGVTKGCNPPENTEFCPEDNVTRGQMAAFMRRFAQYIDAEDGTPALADNASKLGGAGPVFYERPIAIKTGSVFDGTEMTKQNGEIARLTLVTPASGNIIVEHTSSWRDPAAYVVVIWLEPLKSGSVCNNRDDGDAIAGTWTTESLEMDFPHGASASGAGYVSAKAGTHTYSLCLATVSGTSVNVDWSVQAAWYPTDAFNVAGTS